MPPRHSARIHVHLPGHLRRLVGLASTVVTVDVPLPIGGVVTVGDVVAALERVYPALRGTLRDAGSGVRRVRPHIRVFAGSEDLTTSGLSAVLPPAVRDGLEPLRILGAIAGGAQPTRTRGRRSAQRAPDGGPAWR
ncbi:MAG: hypothetical protein QN163_05790 [Armatimonadota bacterium]|nr:hypothetical protein [Armatimonadota bacterium]MDR5697938.1 hypothetical protein [Armatimonadota bacterium]